MDIVERLRNPQGNDLLVTHDAADEIERLRKLNEDWQSAASEAANTAQDVIDELRKERDEHWEVRKKRGALIDRLQAQLITCQKDAERYRWIQDNWCFAHGQIFLDGTWMLTPVTTLDAAIDEAMKREGE